MCTYTPCQVFPFFTVNCYQETGQSRVRATQRLESGKNGMINSGIVNYCSSSWIYFYRVCLWLCVFAPPDLFLSHWRVCWVRLHAIHVLTSVSQTRKQSVQESALLRRGGKQNKQRNKHLDQSVETISTEWQLITSQIVSFSFECVSQALIFPSPFYFHT